MRLLSTSRVIYLFIAFCDITFKERDKKLASSVFVVYPNTYLEALGEGWGGRFQREVEGRVVKSSRVCRFLNPPSKRFPEI